MPPARRKALILSILIALLSEHLHATSQGTLLAAGSPTAGERAAQIEKLERELQTRLERQIDEIERLTLERDVYSKRALACGDLRWSSR